MCFAAVHAVMCIMCSVLHDVLCCAVLWPFLQRRSRSGAARTAPAPFPAPPAPAPQVITQKVVRKQDCITAVDRSHPAYTGFAGVPGGGGGGGSSKGSSGGARVEISYCWRAPSSLRPVFGEAGVRDKERLYSEQEVAAALSSYAVAQGEPAGRAAARTAPVLWLLLLCRVRDPPI